MSEVLEGYKLTKLGEIPVEWEIKNLSEVSPKICVGYVGSINEYYTDSTGVLLLRTGNICEGNINLDDVKFVTREFHEKQKKSMLEPGDLIISRHGDSGSVAIIPNTIKEANCLNVVVIKKSEKIVGEFIASLFNSGWIKKNLAKTRAGSVQGVINTKDIQEISLPIPPIEEQKKIASILLTIDEQVNETEQLIVKTKELKKGLMQQLLTKGIGHTEFKQTELGEIPSNWGICELEDISNLITKGTSPSTYKFDFEEEGINFIRSENILKSNKLDVSNLVKVSGECHEKLSRSKIEAEDILISIAGMFLGKIGIVPKEIVPANTNQAVAIIRLKESVLNAYIFYYLQSTEIRNVIENIATAGAQPNLNLKQVGSFKIKIPSIEEQQKIAEILSTVDEQIDVYEQEKAKYEELKKGLMQKLLTGQIRLKC